MQNNIERAKQFMPFDALKGLKDEIRNREKIKQSKKELSNEQFKDLNNVIQTLNKNNLVRIKYYANLEYIQTVGKIKMIDNIYKKILLLNTTIDFDDIIDIELIDKYERWI